MIPEAGAAAYAAFATRLPITSSNPGSREPIPKDKPAILPAESRTAWSLQPPPVGRLWHKPMWPAALRQ